MFKLITEKALLFESQSFPVPVRLPGALLGAADTAAKMKEAGNAQVAQVAEKVAVAEFAEVKAKADAQAVKMTDNLEAADAHSAETKATANKQTAKATTKLGKEKQEANSKPAKKKETGGDQAPDTATGALQKKKALSERHASQLAKTGGTAEAMSGVVAVYGVNARQSFESGEFNQARKSLDSTGRNMTARFEL